MTTESDPTYETVTSFLYNSIKTATHFLFILCQSTLSQFEGSEWLTMEQHSLNVLYRCKGGPVLFFSAIRFSTDFDKGTY